MARLVAFALLACAAFDWSLPWLDRVGTAALGLAFAVYALPGPPLIRRRAPGVAEPASLLDALDALEPVTRQVADRPRAEVLEP